MLILVRHGESTANRDGLLVGRTDAPLTERGRAQARALQPVLANTVVAYSSPLTRARETAATAMPRQTPVVDDAFIEFHYGELEGTPLAEVGGATWRQLQREHDVPLPGGESMADVDARVRARLVALFEEHDDVVSNPEYHVVIVSHVSPIKAAVAWALGVPGDVAWRIRLDNATTTTIGSLHGRPMLLSYNVKP